MKFEIGTKVRIKRGAPDAYYFKGSRLPCGVLVGPNEIAFVPNNTGYGHRGSSDDNSISNRWYIDECYLELDGPPPKLEDFI